MIDRNDYNTVKHYIAGFVFIPKCIVLGIFNDFRPLSNWYSDERKLCLIGVYALGNIKSQRWWNTYAVCTYTCK